MTAQGCRKADDLCAVCGGKIERENIRTQTMAGREQKAREGKGTADLHLMDINWIMVNLLLPKMKQKLSE